MKTKILKTRKFKQGVPDIRPGDVVRIHEKIKEEKKERIQTFEGLVLARKHGKGISSTITVRKIISGIGVEKIFPIYSPKITKIEVLKRSKVKKGKLYFLRKLKGKKAKLKQKKFESNVYEKETEEKKEEAQKKTENNKEPNKKE